MSARAKSIIRRAMDPLVMMFPARTKNGIAMISCFFVAANISVISRMESASWMSIQPARVPTPTATNNGLPRSTRMIDATTIIQASPAQRASPSAISAPGMAPANTTSIGRLEPAVGFFAVVGGGLITLAAKRAPITANATAMNASGIHSGMPPPSPGSRNGLT